MAASMLGSAVRRIEDPELVTGAAKYVDDLSIPGALHAVFVRSTVAHGRFTVDTDQANGMPGVVAVFTAADLALDRIRPPVRAPKVMRRSPLADGVVRFAGEPVAVVLAETRAQAVDAAEMVIVDVEDLPVVVDAEAALADDAPRLYPEHGSNVVSDTEYAPDDEAFFADADVVVSHRLVNQRLLPCPLETDAIAAKPEDGRLVVWASTQAPHMLRGELAGALGVEPSQVRVIAPAVGGGFGAKIATKVEHIVVAALARRLDRPVRWVDTRSDNLVSMPHGRDQIQHVELGATRDGRLTGLRGQVVANVGAYVYEGAALPFFTYLMSPGVYQLPKVAFRARCVVTNTTPTSAYRGAGRPEATALIERAMDLLAAELDMDPAELRRRNFIPPGDFPHTTVTKTTYDSGDYAKALDAALEHAGYEQLRAEQRARRERGDTRVLGVGLSAYVEITAGGLTSELGLARVEPDGTVTVSSGVSPHGQGLHTALAQVAAAVLKIPMSRVNVVLNDTDKVDHGSGTMGSRSLQTGGTAVFQASNQVVEKAKRIAAEALEVAVEDVVQLDDGRIGVAGAPDRALDLARIAELASDPARLPEGVEPGLSVELDFDQKEPSFPFGVHLAVVAVDTETGRVDLVRHVTVDDCGLRMNPLLVEGQVHGGIAQGAAQALYEGAVYDEGGNLETGSLITYLFPSAADLPSFEAHGTETATPLNPLGVKGIGEAGTIGATPAIQNAVVDALSHLGIRHLDMPLTPARVWQAVHAATKGS